MHASRRIPEPNSLRTASAQFREQFAHSVRTACTQFCGHSFPDTVLRTQFRGHSFAVSFRPDTFRPGTFRSGTLRPDTFRRTHFAHTFQRTSFRGHLGAHFARSLRTVFDRTLRAHVSTGLFPTGHFPRTPQRTVCAHFAHSSARSFARSFAHSLRIVSRTVSRTVSRSVLRAVLPMISGGHS